MREPLCKQKIAPQHKLFTLLKAFLSIKIVSPDFKLFFHNAGVEKYCNCLTLVCAAMVPKYTINRVTPLRSFVKVSIMMGENVIYNLNQ